MKMQFKLMPDLIVTKSDVCTATIILLSTNSFKNYFTEHKKIKSKDFSFALFKK